MTLRRLLLGSLLLVLACAGVGTGGEPPRLGKEDLKPLLGRPDVAVIDVRASGDWDSSADKIAGAVREDPNGVKAWMGRYAKDKTLVLYCA